MGYFKVFGRHEVSDLQPEGIETTDTFPHPRLLHPLQRVFMIILLIAFIVGLELSLQFSLRNNGLGDAGENPYFHIVWTSCPALILTLVAMYFASTDLTIRKLAPYEALCKETAFEESVTVNLADRAIPSALFQALKTRNLAVVGAAIAMFLASHFAILVAPVYSAVLVPAVDSIQLTSRDSFAQADGTQPVSQNGTILASLILDANFPYPPSTFEDIAIPMLDVVSIDSTLPLTDESTITVTVPAVRPFMDCRIIHQADIRTNLTRSNVTSLRVSLPGEPSGNITISLGQNTTGNMTDPNAFFGVGKYRPIALVTGVVSHWVYIWGQLSKADTNKPDIQMISAMVCNETVQQVGTLVSLLGSSMVIDPSHPPVPNDSTATSLALALTEIDYGKLMNTSARKPFLDPFFATLISSQQPIPLSDLGSKDDSAAQSVADAITRQHKIIRTQVISTENRRSVETISIGKPQAAVVGKPTTFSGLITSRSVSAGSTRRVIQDMFPTRILQGIIAATILASVACWIGMPQPNILPRSPNSIGSAAAFLADGNLFGLLGRGAEWQSTNELRAFFMDGMHVTMRFKIGWDQLRRRRRDEALSVWGTDVSLPKDQSFAISAVRTGGWGGGEGVGLGLQARVGFAHRRHVRDWGWRT